MFTEGVLAMQTTLVGVVKVEPKRLLDDGIRKELVLRLATSLDHLIGNAGGRIDVMRRQLQLLAETLDGFRRSFQYIQDYIHVQGLKLWQEEFIRIINFHVELECNALLLNTKAFDPSRSVYQSRECPIPLFTPKDKFSVTFIGRLARDLLALTDCTKTFYVPSAQTWYDADYKVLVNNDLLTLVLRGIDVFGMKGLNNLYAFMVAREFIDVQKKLKAAMTKDVSARLETFANSLYPYDTLTKNVAALYNTTLKETRKLWIPLFEAACRIGQLQLLRQSLTALLGHTCRSDSNLLACTAEALNDSLIKDITAHYKEYSFIHSFQITISFFLSFFFLSFFLSSFFSFSFRFFFFSFIVLFIIFFIIYYF